MDERRKSIKVEGEKFLIKTCTCGNVLTDATVPNKNVYWTYFQDEWELRKKWYQNPTLETTIRDFWYCNNCRRIYSRVPICGDYYTFLPQKQTDDSIDFWPIEDNTRYKKIYVLSEEDEDIAWDNVIDGVEPEFSREVVYDFINKLIYIRKNQQVKVYEVENVTPYTL